MSTWWEHLAPTGAKPWVLVARNGSQLIGLLPLVLEPFLRATPVFRQLSFMGSGVAAGDHLDWLIDANFEAPVADAFITRLADAPVSAFDFDGVRENSKLVQAMLEDQRVSRAHWVTRQTCPYLALPESWDAYVSSLSRKRRYNMRRRADRIETDAGAPVSYQLASDPVEIDQSLAALFELKTRSLPGRRAAIHFPRKFREDFHQNVARRFLELGWLRLYSLKIGEESVAVSYCLAFEGQFNFYQTGFDPAWAKYSLGAAVISHSIQAAIEEGAHTFDLLRGDEPYKYGFTKTTRDVLRIRIARDWPAKVTLGAYMSLRSVRRTAISKLRQLQKRRVTS